MKTLLCIVALVAASACAPTFPRNVLLEDPDTGTDAAPSDGSSEVAVVQGDTPTVDQGPDGSVSDTGACAAIAGQGCVCNTTAGLWHCVGETPVCVCSVTDGGTPPVDSPDVAEVATDSVTDSPTDSPDSVDVAEATVPPDTNPVDVATDTNPVDTAVVDTGPRCGSEQMLCGMACVNPMADVSNCGGCGRTCTFPNASAGCSAASCTLTLCAPGYADCDRLLSNGCERPVGSDNLNCGACGRACPSGTACVGGACAGICPTGQSLCSGTCMALTTDTNCSACGNACGGGQTCVGGVCRCGPTQALCGGVCTNTTTDTNNCGTCGRSCSGGGRVCAFGECACTGGQTLCGSTCYDTLNDPNHCGGCAACPPVVNGTATCGVGRCGFLCNVGYVTTGAGCVPCGGGGQPVCTGTATACRAGLTNCGGTCRDLDTDATSCGVCGNVCPGGSDCGLGVCLEQRSCRTEGTAGCGVVEVAGGTFTLGDTDTSGGSVNGTPAQVGVRVSAFAIDRTEVTVARFTAFWSAGHPAPSGPVVYPSGSIAAEGSVVAPNTTGQCNWTVTGRGAHPINCVTHATAQAFCVWDGGRLPTEAEWEYAARRTSGAPFPWRTNDSPGDRACWSGGTVGGRVSTCPVGTFTTGSTPDGIADMSGNVYEWTADWHRPYTDTGCWGGTHLSNPLCNTPSGNHPFRGGSWDSNNPAQLRSMTRIPISVSFADRSIGFRCVRSR